MNAPPKLRNIRDGFAEVWSASGLVQYGYVQRDGYPEPAPGGGCCWHAHTLQLKADGTPKRLRGKDVRTTKMCGSRRGAAGYVARLGAQTHQQNWRLAQRSASNRRARR